MGSRCSGGKDWRLGLGLLCLLVLVSSRQFLQVNSLTVEEFSSKETNVITLGKYALQLATDTEDCGLSLCVDNCARHACSAVSTDNFQCISTQHSVQDCEDLNPSKTCFQIQLDFSRTGFVRDLRRFELEGERVPDSHESVIKIVLGTTRLQGSATFFELLEFESETRNQARNLLAIESSVHGEQQNQPYYFGSAEGVWRSYPGRVQDPKNGCISYDPRKRPWYILATAVVKDLVVLLDTGQQSVTTFNSAIDIISELFDTFRVIDSVNVVTFDSTQATMKRPSSILIDVNTSGNGTALLPMFGIANLTNTANGGSWNLSLGLDTALSALNPTSDLNVILVISDGSFSKSATFVDDIALRTAIEALNANNVIVFFFTIGPLESDDPSIDQFTALRSLSCQMNSTVTYVSNLDAYWNPMWSIRSYFDYQAKMRYVENQTFWTDPYTDFDGLGPVATVTYPVFQGGTLFGVVGIDVFLDGPDDISIIATKSVNPLVPAIALGCQRSNVNLSQCTKAVDPGLQPLCPQDEYLNEKPEHVYKKLLCCGACGVKETKNLLQLIYLPVIGLGAVVIPLIFIIIVLAAKYTAARKCVREILDEFARASISTKLLTYHELRKATRNFHKDNKLGEGGFGEVFLGKIRDGTAVAVKRLSDDSKQGMPQFLAEVTIISKVLHRNLVKLRGCCVEGQRRLLVYEYLPNKSLRESLLGVREQLIPMDWATRFNIAVGAARGLAYLHDEVAPRIIHRDIKASNILLDENLEAKISDFGLAKLCPDEQTHLTTAMAGTLGYMAPEMTRGQLTEKVDVFAYGILLMEIVTGRVTITTVHGSPLCLIDEVRDLYRKAQESGKDEYLLRLVDPNLRHVYDADEVIRVLKISLLCSNDVANSRPSISQVVSMLLGTQDVPEYLLKSLLHSLQSSPSGGLTNLDNWDDTDEYCSISPVNGSASRGETGTISPVDLTGR